VFTIFPQKFSKKDIIYLSRENNEAGVTGLTYTLTATGVADLTGSFKGTNAKFEVFIDLATWLKSAASVSKIHLKIKDNKNNVIVDSDINLVQ
jgi:hypothetical protein